MGREVSSWRWVRRDDVDDDRWNRVVRSDERSLPYGLTEVLDARAKQWGGLVRNDYEAVCPIPYRRVAGCVNVARMPLGLQQLGIFFAPSCRINSEANSVDEWSELYSALEVLPKNFIWLDLHFHEGLPLIKSEGAWWKSGPLSWMRCWNRQNAVLHLEREYQLNFEGFSEQTRRNVKKAQSAQLGLFEHDSPEVLIQAFEQHQVKRYGAMPNDFLNSVRWQMHALIHQRKGMVQTVYGPGNEFLAGAFWWFHGDRMILYFSTVTEAGRDLQAMSYLINEVVLQASGTWSRLDFEGSQAPGLFRFYLGWGAQPKPYLRVQRFRIPFP
jgi:hypothetical protein